VSTDSCRTSEGGSFWEVFCFKVSLKSHDAALCWTQLGVNKPPLIILFPRLSSMSELIFLPAALINDILTHKLFMLTLESQRVVACCCDVTLRLTVTMAMRQNNVRFRFRRRSI